MSTTIEFKPVKDLTYGQATAELNAIIAKIQQNQCDIDHLALLTRRATELIAECRSRLTATDEELQKILSSLQS